MSSQLPKRTITVSQIVADDGVPRMACHTEPLWVDRAETDVFSGPTTGNKIESLTTGQEYFERLILDCDGASKEIYIAGWQVNWDSLLAPGLRLYDLLYRCAARGVNVYVMPWDDTEPIQTYDDQTKVALESINARIAKSAKKGRVIVELCPSFAGINSTYFSHHQKQVIIDRKIGFVGGIDLAYGRMDDATFGLTADAHGRQMLNRYNPGLPPLQVYKASDPAIADPDLIVGAVDRFGFSSPFTAKKHLSNSQVHRKRAADGAWQVRYEKAGALGTAPNSSALAGNTPGNTTLDPRRQPRMPWQDVHTRIEGPAVSDLIRNFVMRWNVVSKIRLDMPLPPDSFPKAGNAQIQVLRSAPSQHCERENKQAKSGKSNTQQDIHVAMKNLIRKARHFIYIEQQFFVSDFGEIGGPQGELSPAAQFIKSGKDGVTETTLGALRWTCKGDVADRLPLNGVLKALLARLRKTIVDDVSRPDFHVYITLPVHPEGALTDPAIAVQVYYTMQTLVSGSNSLLNGIKRLLKARELKDKKDPNYFRVIQDPTNSEHESVSDEACYRYVTLLNLRNWEKIGNGFVTEQIYVHSKLMIVDDRFALVGSANINDRSLLGERDSELAVLIMDDDTERADINGTGSNMPVRAFAHQLRKKIWLKLFGITSSVRPATELLNAIAQPACPRSWNLIQKRAQQNASIYEQAFSFIPRSFVLDNKNARVAASIIPNWDAEAFNPKSPKIPGYPAAALPSDDLFWTKPYSIASPGELTNIKGFITALPISWTKGENIRIRYPSPLIVDRDGGHLRDTSSDIALSGQPTGDHQIERG
jgi:phospholipase D1/2